MHVMELERYLKHRQLPFFQRDIRNLYVKMRKNAKLLKKRTLDSNMRFITDEENRLEHIFWSPTHCFDWYQKYGDAVIFYTTYKENAYDMSFGVFVGVNNHEKTILFGCAPFQIETTSAF